MAFSDVQQIDNGARFYNADLHIHSYGASSDVNDATMTPEAIVDSAVTQGLSIIAITDHNSNKNVQRAVDHAQQSHAGKILVLPGVEVTTAHGHLLVYFASDQPAALAKFISRLDLVGEMGEDNTRTAKSMSDVIKEAHALGGLSIAAHIDRDKTGFDKFASGFQNWKRDILTSPGLYGLECDAVNTLLWYSENDSMGEGAAERSKIFLARQEVDELKPRHHLAHVQGSDAHSLANFEQRNPSKPWTRIKLSEFTFAAFRVALIDPTARVRACGSVPLAIPRIRGVVLTGGFLHAVSIHFSDNLNSFIGGRGTGKSTAIRAIAYAFGLVDEFGEYDNCPDSVTVYCEDANGIFYRYTRNRGGEIEVNARGVDGNVSEVPIDSFHIEYFGQGELAKVAENPLKTPQLFQDFLDRHTTLRDLIETEESLVSQLRENAGKLEPIENSFGHLGGKKKTLDEIKAKLKIAEEGKLKDIIKKQNQLASEKAVRENIETTVTAYNTGWNLSAVRRDFDALLQTAGECTDDAGSQKTMASIRAAFDKINQEVTQLETALNTAAKTCAAGLTKYANELRASHQRLSGEIAQKIAELKAKGQATDLPGLQALLQQKTTLASEIATVEQRTQERDQLRKERDKLRKSLAETRAAMTKRRKEQLRGINQNLSTTIKDYTVFVRYDDDGITDEFEEYMRDAMHGTYLQDTTIHAVCSRINPSELADLVLARNITEISNHAKIGPDWAEQIVQQLCYWAPVFELQALSKPPKPIINVQTKSNPPRRIPVFQLSDGQRHTILLTIAMLAETNVPLVIDQPEDDLDNAFIFSSIVATLRAIKERRQVILVTHNANIAVLGDSELILPMWRENDCGNAKDRGSIDTEATKVCVQNILEGGPAAFLRRKEIYGY